MKIYTSEQMRRIDAYTTEAEGIDSWTLMERAAQAFTGMFLDQFQDATQPVVVFAGPGNNGGDGLAVARMLAEAGRDVRVYLFNTGQKMSADCSRNKQLITAGRTSLQFNEITSQFTPPHLDAQTIVIDALFGTGLSRPLEGGFAAVVRYINASAATVVSIDVPSGLMTEDNTDNLPSNIMRANFTYTFHAPKLAFLFAENERYVGQWAVLDIGLKVPDEPDMRTPYHLTERREMQALLHSLSRFTHKGMQGHALLMAGRKDVAGAAVLAAKSCLRGGVGKLTVDSQEENRTILQTAVPEAIVHIEPKFVKDPFRPNQLPEPLSLPIDDFDAMGIGPAIGTDEQTTRRLAALLPGIGIPLVLDADALTILGINPVLMNDLPHDTILTPHKGELRRLIGQTANSLEELNKTLDLARQYGIYVLIKGAYSAVVSPLGQVYFNPTGNPGMATAGAGDVLTGLLLALLAQQYAPLDALRLGVFLHGSAGDLAARDGAPESVIASDLVAYLPQAFRVLKQKN